MRKIRKLMPILNLALAGQQPSPRLARTSGAWKKALKVRWSGLRLFQNNPVSRLPLQKVAWNWFMWILAKLAGWYPVPGADPAKLRNYSDQTFGKCGRQPRNNVLFWCTGDFVWLVSWRCWHRWKPSTRKRLRRPKVWYMTTTGPTIMWWKTSQILLRILVISFSIHLFVNQYEPPVGHVFGGNNCLLLFDVTSFAFFNVSSCCFLCF